jgi:hypothetical protein
MGEADAGGDLFGIGRKDDRPGFLFEGRGAIETVRNEILRGRRRRITLLRHSTVVGPDPFVNRGSR